MVKIGDKRIDNKAKCNFCGFVGIPLCSCGRPLSQIYFGTSTETHYSEDPIDHHELIEHKNTYREWDWYCDYCGKHVFPHCSKCESPNVEPSLPLKEPKSCFITTACCEFKGLPDDCDLLMTLRHFRDTFMSEKYPADLLVYYEISPKIVESIHKRKDSDEIWESTYTQLIEAELLIDSKRFEEAYQKYRDLVLDLQDKCS